MFCDELGYSDLLIANPDLDVISKAIEYLVCHSNAAVCASQGTNAGIEIYRTPDGALILGSEDSDRFNYGFYFYDPLRDHEARTVSIHSCINANICTDIESVEQILTTFVMTGDLDRRYNWSLNVLTAGDLMDHDRQLLAGDHRPLREILSNSNLLPCWPQPGE